jgi:hypothetical protein
MNFIFTWLFDKLGYMPKIDFQIGKVDLKAHDVWPFPVSDKPTKKKKPTLKKATTRKAKAPVKTPAKKK